MYKQIKELKELPKLPLDSVSFLKAAIRFVILCLTDEDLGKPDYFEILKCGLKALDIGCSLLDELAQ